MNDNILDITNKETEAFIAFKTKYEKLNPPPKKPSMQGLGWQFWLTLPCALAAIVLAAIRTAQIFYTAASFSGLGDFLSLIEAATAMIAIEGGLVIYAAIRADKKAQDKDVNALQSHDKRLFYAILLMVLISIMAGLGQSVAVIKSNEVISEKIQYALFFVTGIGASLIAWIGGEVLGSQVALAAIRNKDRVIAWKQAMNEYQQSLRTSWMRSQERKIIRGELIINRNFPKVSENFYVPDGFPIDVKDWRRLRPLLSDKHIQWILTERPDVIARALNVTERTISNWKTYLTSELTNDDVS